VAGSIEGTIGLLGILLGGAHPQGGEGEGTGEEPTKKSPAEGPLVEAAPGEFVSFVLFS
jgi:hypothetical protein